MHNIRPILASLLAALVLTLGFTVKAWLGVRTARDRLLRNQNVLLHNGRVELSRTASGNSLASVPALTLKKSEFRQSGDTLVRIARAMGVRPSRIVSAATASAETSADITVPVISPPADTCGAGRFTHSDPWLSITGRLYTDTATAAPFSNGQRRQLANIHLLSLDTLDIIVHRVPKRFLFFRFGCKAVRMNISSRNPHTRLVYARYYRLED